MTIKEEDLEIASWVENYFSNSENETENLVTILQELQGQFGYIPKQGMKRIAAHMGITPANVYAVATFYNQFRFVPPGRHQIKVCMGTACAIKGGKFVLDQWERRLNINTGEVTEDREYSLDRVDCVGCCTLAPVAVIGEDVHANMDAIKVDGLLFRHQMEREKQAKEAADTESKESS